MATTDNDPATYETTISESSDAFGEQGYVAQFAAAEGGIVRCFSCRTDTDASSFTIDALERSEGASDPADMVANVAAQCPSCGAKGVLTLKYGPEASIEEQEVLAIIDDNRNTWSGGTSI